MGYKTDYHFTMPTTNQVLSKYDNDLQELTNTCLLLQAMMKILDDLHQEECLTSFNACFFQNLI